MTTNPIHAATIKAQAADDLFSAELTKAFGKDACERRYSYKRDDWPASLRAAHAAFQAAAEEQHEAFKASRA